MKTTDKYTFFWNGILSNWYHSKFVLEGIQFNCVEQYMMWKKAILFHDGITAMLILQTSNPKEQKALGRKVKDFDKEVWESNCKEIVYNGCYAKFIQNPELLKFLMNTGETEIVEASPYDNIWGIGLSEDDPIALDKSQWKGTNWLGNILTDLRDNLRKSD